MRRHGSKGVCLMMKLQPFSQQDRPKMIAAVIGIAVALTFVVHSLGGTLIQAQSGGSAGAAAPAAPLSGAISLPPSCLSTGDAPMTADQAFPDSAFCSA